MSRFNNKPDNETAYARLASELGVSRSTVSKALRHCQGINTATRELVLHAAKNVKELRNTATCDIYCILPDTPSFFWQDLLRGIEDGIRENNSAHSYTVKCNVYSRLHDEATILTYLEEAADLNARCLIVTAAITDTIRKRIATFCADGSKFVILLSEYGDITNSFYVGADAYRDGAEMAEKVLEYQKCNKSCENIFVLSVGSNTNISLRIDGFLNSLTEKEQNALTTITIESERMYSPKTLPAYLAALFTKAIPLDHEALLYVPMGLPAFPLALKKSGLEEYVKCFCHDIIPDRDLWIPNKTIVFCCTQNIYRQALTAVRLAFTYLHTQTYPADKHVLFSSKFLSPDGTILCTSQ